MIRLTSIQQVLSLRGTCPESPGRCASNLLSHPNSFDNAMAWVYLLLPLSIQVNWRLKHVRICSQTTLLCVLEL